MPQLDVSTFSSQIFWLVVSFTALFLIVWRIGVPKISHILETRQKRIDDNLLRAEEFKREAEAALKIYEASLEEARSEAQAILVEASTLLAEEFNAREAELIKALSKRISESEENISNTVDNAIEKISDAAADVAANAVERLTGEAPGADEVAAAVNTVIKNADREPR